MFVYLSYSTGYGLNFRYRYDVSRVVDELASSSREVPPPHLLVPLVALSLSALG